MVRLIFNLFTMVEVAQNKWTDALYQWLSNCAETNYLQFSVV